MYIHIYQRVPSIDTLGRGRNGKAGFPKMVKVNIFNVIFICLYIPNPSSFQNCCYVLESLRIQNLLKLWYFK